MGLVPWSALPGPAAVRTGALVAAVLLALAAVGSAVVAGVNAWVLSPQATAESYLDAVADRDVAGVLDHLATSPETRRELFLTEKVLDSDDFVPISDVSIGDVQEYGTSASVRVTYSVGDEAFEDSIDLVQGEERFGLFRSWEVATPPGSLLSGVRPGQCGLPSKPGTGGPTWCRRPSLDSARHVTPEDTSRRHAAAALPGRSVDTRSRSGSR